MSNNHGRVLHIITTLICPYQIARKQSIVPYNISIIYKTLSFRLRPDELRPGDIQVNVNRLYNDLEGRMNK